MLKIISMMMLKKLKVIEKEMKVIEVIKILDLN